MTERVFIACEASWHYSNERHFDSFAPTQVRHFENRVWCIGYPDGQATIPASKNILQSDVMVVQQWARVFWTHQCLLNTSSN
jgi:hypothetical protein